MDTSKEYVEMCYKAVEVQQLPIKKEKGSVFCAYEIIPVHHFDGRKEERRQEYILYYGLSGFHHGPHYHFDYYPGDFWQIFEGNTTKYFDEVPVWLPRQDQLQEILITNGYPPIKSLFSDMAEECWEYDDDYENLFNTGEKVWLSFVMKEKFKKVWNGQDWVLDT